MKSSLSLHVAWTSAHADAEKDELNDDDDDDITVKRQCNDARIQEPPVEIAPTALGYTF